MPVDFSIKQVPDDVAERLRERASRNHRSLQGELRAILEEAVSATAPLNARALYERSVARGRIDTGKATVALIREMRNERTGRLADVSERRPARKPRR